MAFFEAAAQVMPLIFFALAFELRYFTSEGLGQVLLVIAALWVFSLLIAGEAVALVVLRSGEVTSVATRFVSTAMVVASVALVLPFLAQLLQKLHRAIGFVQRDLGLDRRTAWFIVAIAGLGGLFQIIATGVGLFSD